MCSSASGSKSTEHSSQQKFAEPAEPLIQPLQHCLQSLELPITHVVHERLKWCANTSPLLREMPEVTDVRWSLLIQGRWGAQKEFDVHFKVRNLSSLSHLVMSSFWRKCFTEVCLTERLFYGFINKTNNTLGKDSLQNISTVLARKQVFYLA